MLFHIANEKYGINNPISKQFETLFSMKKKKNKTSATKYMNIRAMNMKMDLAALIQVFNWQ